MQHEAVVVFQGTEAQVEPLATMLQARGIDAVTTPRDRVDAPTDIAEAVIRVPQDQAEDARALIEDVLSGAAERR